MSWAQNLDPARGVAPASRVVPRELLRRPRTAGSIAFPLLVSLGALLGGLLMTGVLLLTGAPGAVALGVTLAAIPVGPLVGCYVWLDRYEPEPRWLLALAFVWGACIATAVALVLQAIDQYFVGTSVDWSAAFVAPLTEEFAKGLFLVLLLWFRRHELDGVLDGLVYAGLVGIGFAFVENVLYLVSAYAGGDHLGAGGLGSATSVFVMRGIMSPFAHPLFTSCIGIGVGIAAATRRAWLRPVAVLVGYACAVTLHAAWNASAFFHDGTLFLLTYVIAMVPAFALMVAIATGARRREQQMLTRSLTDAASRGLVEHAEVPWLVRLPARRAARSYARSTGGPTAEEAMKVYQADAIDLAFVHDRYLRGLADGATATRGNELVRRLGMLRPYVLFPPTKAGHLWSSP
ncbi:MAG: PrsW family intramembrane metalloprotease [Nocardioidaceae bacterium]